MVYGDIGTSPLYAMREAFHGQHGIPVTSGNVSSIRAWSDRDRDGGGDLVM